MATTYAKVGDQKTIGRQLKDGNVDPSSTPILGEHSIFISGHTAGSVTDALFSRRNITTTTNSKGVPAENKIAFDLWDGRTAPTNATTVAVADKSVNGKINVNFPASGETGTTAEIWMTKAGGTTFYRVAEGLADDGSYVSTPYVIDIADADLEREHSGENRSLTFGESAAIADQAAPTAALAGAGAGNVDNGSHDVAVIIKRHGDSNVERKIDFEIIKTNRRTGEEITYPSNPEAWEHIEIVTESP